MKHIPLGLIYTRVLLGIVIVFLAWNANEQGIQVIPGLIFLAILTDIFDGIIARRLKISSDKLRRADSQADVFFWLCVLAGSFIAFKILMMDNITLITTILIIEGLCYLISFIRFKKEHCVHAWCSKLWNINLTIAFMLLFAFGYSSTMKVALIHGVVALTDVLLIILILPKWDRDIPSFVHAIWLRQGKKIKRYKLLNG